MTKLIIIGIDGGTFNIINPLIEKGELPNLKHLTDNGIKAKLKSTNPPLTCPAWPSFMTGKNPANHKLTTFVDENNNIASYDKIKGTCFWDILAKNNIKSLIINVPVTYPPYIQNGIMVSSMLTPPNANFVYPRELKEEIENMNYIVSFDVDWANDLNKHFNTLLKMIEKRYELYNYLRKKENFDIEISVFSATDIVCHKLWNNKEKIKEVYRKVDDIIGEITKQDANFIIMSDHGFGGYNKLFRVNQWLEKEGYLVRTEGHDDYISPLRRKTITNKKFFGKLGITKENTYKALGKLGMNGLIKHIPKSLKNLVPASNKKIDEENSKAWVSNYNPHSIILKDKNIKEEVMQKLKDLNVFRNVLGKKEAFGNDDSGLPDIYIDTDDCLISSDFGESVFSEESGGKHHSDGIFIAYGEDIRKIDLNRINIIDIAPTILDYFGVKHEMDNIIPLFKNKGFYP